MVFDNANRLRLVLGLCLIVAPPTAEAASKPRQAKDVVSFQVGKAIVEEAWENGGKIVLTNLSVHANRWYLLEFRKKNGGVAGAYHLENQDPDRQSIKLGEPSKGVLTVKRFSDDKGMDKKPSIVPTPQCPVSPQSLDKLTRQAKKQGEAYFPLCDLKVQLRVAIEGRQSSKEAVAGFLRKHIWGGEKITQLVKQTVYKDKFKLEGGGGVPDGIGGDDGQDTTGPRLPELDPEAVKTSLSIRALGIPLARDLGAEKKSVVPGRWYQSRYDANVYLSVVEPGSVSQRLMKSHRKIVKRLDNVEKKALAVLVAFKMDAFDFGYMIGTEHPGVNWSDRVTNISRGDATGPDGFGTIAPLVGTGRVTNRAAQNIAATFTGGFKRTHGGFRHGTLAKKNNGSHYGFMESGVTLSALQPGLATIVIDKHQNMDMMTWPEVKGTQKNLGDVVHARQNGVPIIQGMDDFSGIAIPGDLVGEWGRGNWSGSIDRKQRALRAGICIAERDRVPFLIYGYFSTATPSAMARVFQAYHCRYAMHLDMNALEHTYLATYSFNRGKIRVHNLIDEMKVLDRYHEGEVSPRFIGLSDNRDFFYLTHRGSKDDQSMRKDRDSGALYAAAAPASQSTIPATKGRLSLGKIGGAKPKSTLRDQNERLFGKLRDVHGLDQKELSKVKDVFSGSRVMGQGNPKVAAHPMTEAQCQDKLKKSNVTHENAKHEKICGDKYMAPLYRDGASEDQAKSCIDKFEFPNIPCQYPVVWVRADEAAKLCQAVGKRLCDAHEWEGACAGSLEDPDYGFASLKGLSSTAAIKKMRRTHNARESGRKSWSYGKTRRKGICAANSTKSKGCNGGDWKRCGSNTYPVGAFPECRSKLDVYDIHGNAAEHMNLPVKPEEMASAGSKDLGYTEMKGSWFIFDKYKAHKDFCRWRAPFWHGTRVMSKKSHHNYHLGFRCCKTL